MNRMDREVAVKESKFINNMLDHDSKNYHAWAYRQWICKRFENWDWAAELTDMNFFIDDDIRNNSAWNHRYFIFKNRPEGFTEESFENEIM
ncbi:hypothetical protein HDU97_009668 [Phlyctochytrium planicorne]|nr:hypothetical protein HDU97_009668 [Phlyctochytrium planicorne]